MLTLSARPSPSPFTNLLVWKLWRPRRILKLELFYMSNGVEGTPRPVSEDEFTRRAQKTQQA